MHLLSFNYLPGLHPNFCDKVFAEIEQLINNDHNCIDRPLDFVALFLVGKRQLAIAGLASLEIWLQPQ